MNIAGVHIHCHVIAHAHHEIPIGVHRHIIALLADLMGHESIETTRIYLRRTASEQQALVDKIVTW